MFERSRRRVVAIVPRSGRSIATLVLSSAGIVLAGMAWSEIGPIHSVMARPRAQVQAPAKGFIATPSPDPAIVRARNAAKQGLLDLEDAISRAELVIAVRMLDVFESKIVRGGKQQDITLQYRFEPVRTLKGIYARDVLLLTGQDLGIYRYGAGPDKVERGQVFLLLLGRNGPGYYQLQSGRLARSVDPAAERAGRSAAGLGRHADRRDPAARPVAEGGPADRRAADVEGAGRRAASWSR